jgi:hypothetical protein
MSIALLQFRVAAGPSYPIKDSQDRPSRFAPIIRSRRPAQFARTPKLSPEENYFPGTALPPVRDSLFGRPIDQTRGVSRIGPSFKTTGNRGITHEHDDSRISKACRQTEAQRQAETPPFGRSVAVRERPGGGSSGPVLRCPAGRCGEPGDVSSCGGIRPRPPRGAREPGQHGRAGVIGAAASFRALAAEPDPAWLSVAPGPLASELEKAIDMR